MALLNFLWVFENKQIFYEQNMIEQISIEKPEHGFIISLIDTGHIFSPF